MSMASGCSRENNGANRRASGMVSRSPAERSAYFARREAARVLRSVLHGDAGRCAVASIKATIYGPSVRNKRATFALVCETLKRLPLIKDILASLNILTSKWKRQTELVYVTAYDILFGQEIAMSGAVEKFLLPQKSILKSALQKLLVQEKFKPFQELLGNQRTVYSKPRYVRVNTLKVDLKSAIQELQKINSVLEDEMVPDVLVLPSGTDLHDHPLVNNGSVILQGKASSMVAVTLSPKPGWKVLDACAAPGNKTVHLAAIMKGKGEIIACELNEKRVKTLEGTIKRAGAPNIKIMHEDFLKLDPMDSAFSGIRAILLDPSCSGSGISAQRLDYLLPSYVEGNYNSDITSGRVRKLAVFQRKALAHALSFPSVVRVVYSTCSIHQTENEDVVESVLPLAASLNFELATPFPEWPQRGLPVFEGCNHLLRTDPSTDTEGFFIALFVRKPTAANTSVAQNQSDRKFDVSKRPSKKKRKIAYYFGKLSRPWFLPLVKKRQKTTERIS